MASLLVISEGGSFGGLKNLNNCSPSNCYWAVIQAFINAYILSIAFGDLAGLPNDIKYKAILLKDKTVDSAILDWN